MQAEFTTDNWLLKKLRLIRLDRILPIGNFVHLKLGFKNIGSKVIPNIENVNWRIIYPPGSKEVRIWTLNIPKLEIDQAVWTKPEWLFMPKVSGQHTMMLFNPPQKEDLNYASPYGLVGRKYEYTNDGWTASFYILNRGAYITIIIILMTVVLTFFSIFNQVFPRFFPSFWNGLKEAWFYITIPTVLDWWEFVGEFWEKYLS